MDLLGSDDSSVSEAEAEAEADDRGLCAEGAVMGS